MSLRRCLTLLIWLVVLPALLLVGCKPKSYIKVLNIGMEPTLKIDEIYEVKPVVLDDLKRGDLVVFKRNNETFVKRLIGLPGETIEMRDGKVYINDEHLVEEYSQNPHLYPVNYGPATLEENQYFVLGDNRRFSMDSHTFGPIDGDSIYEQVVLPE